MSTLYKITLKNHTPIISYAAVNLAHLLGFESACLSFPIVDKSIQNNFLWFELEQTQSAAFSVLRNCSSIKILIPNNLETALEAIQYVAQNFIALAGTSAQQGNEVCKPEFSSSTSQAEPVTCSQSKKRSGLEHLFDSGFILQDQNNDMLPDSFPLCFSLSPNPSYEQTVAACNFAARFGAETTCIQLPIVAISAKNIFELKDSSTCRLSYAEKEDNLLLTLEGQGQELIDFSSQLCETFPLQAPGFRWEDLLISMEQSLSMKNLDGQLTYLHAQTQSSGTICYASPTIAFTSQSYANDFPAVTFKNHRQHTLVHQKEYCPQWEMEQLMQQMEQEFWPHVKSGDRLSFLGAVSEDRETRAEFELNFCKKAAKVGALVERSTLFCAYKQGFSWLEEFVLPQAKLVPSIHSVAILVSPFQKGGATAWDSESGAVPNHNSLQNEQPEEWFDLPIRFLQELYPIDDILAEALGIDRANIAFSLAKEEQPDTYCVSFLEKDGSTILEQTYTSHFSERPYLSAFPNTGLVHPPTGYITATINDTCILNHHIATDVERIWEIYQDEILPFVGSWCMQNSSQPLMQDMQPFFSKIQLEIDVSEPDFNLPCRQDRFSTLDALHEDIYFAGLDYFKMLGSSTKGEPLDAPGLILPLIRKSNGAPRLRFSLWQHLRPTPCIEFSNGTCRKPLEQNPRVGIQEIGFFNNTLSATLHVASFTDDASIVESYTSLLSQNKLTLNRRFTQKWQLFFTTSEKQFTASIQPSPIQKKELPISSIDIMEDRLIHYDAYLAIVKQLEQVPGIAVYPIAETYEGREIHAIELLPTKQGYQSQIKRINRAPVQIINARHHANEISSTNASFMLLKEILENPIYDKLADQMTLILVPFENADGAEIHYQLQQENPEWKLHAARFNATGKEFYYEYFNDKTIYTEALGFTRLWRRFLPDIVVDNHGVPKHEWDQPFSGYTSPSYKGFWLPRSLLYGYFWYVSNPEYSENKRLNKEFENAVADSINADENIVAWNKEWQNRFEKYAHSWMPNLFPADYYRGMINYWVPFEYDAAHRYPSIRYPWITSVAYTSEVADETATGVYLQQCARTHVCHDLAILKLVRHSKSVFCKGQENSNGVYKKYYIRQRPIISYLLNDDSCDIIDE